MRYTRGMMKVIICDDHPVCCEGLKTAFSQTTDMRAVGEAHTGPELLELLESTPCDAVILDVSLPGASGLEVLAELTGRRPAVPVLMLSMHGSDEYAIRALRLGAAGYLPKDTSVSELIAAIRKVVAGGRYVSAAQADMLAEELRRGQLPSREKLSERERQVLLGLAAGHGISEIARELRVSPSTVGTHRNRVLDKLGLRTNADLIRYAVENRLLAEAPQPRDPRQLPVPGSRG